MRIAERAYAPGLRLRAHAHEEPSLSLVTAGMFRESRSRRSETALPFSVSFMGADLEHDDEFGPAGATMLQVHLEPEAGEEFRRHGCSVLSHWTWLHGGPAVRPFVRLLRAFRSGEDDALLAQMVFDVVAAGSGERIGRGEPPRWLAIVREAIDDMHGWPRVADLASIAGVHRVYLARQFRRFFGCSVSAYIRRRRVQAAAHRLGTDRSTLSAAAHACGFHDHAHMCRAIGAETGLTPSLLRAELRNRPRHPPV